MKSWISSAFGDLPSTPATTAKNFSTQTRSTNRSSTVRATETATRTPRVAQNENINPSIKPKTHPNATKPNLKANKSEQNLIEKYFPSNRAELVVNKSKVDQLSSTIDSIIGQKKGSILVIDGPTGCGKSCTLKVLCKEKNIELVAWSPSSLNLTSLDPGAGSEMDIGVESQIKLFQQFLFKSSRYESDQLFSHSLQNQNNSSRKLLLLVKEIPNVFFRDGGRSQFASCLRQFVKYSKHSIVFVVTQTSYSNNGNDNCNPNRLFTNDVKKELGVVEINFNAIANTFMVKFLERIAKSEGLKGVDRGFLDSLCQVANGDLRNAVNTLEMTCVGRTKDADFKLSQPTVKRSVQRKRKQQQDDVIILNDDSNSNEASGGTNNLENSSKNINYTIFRGIGKILHRKNMDENECSKWTDEDRERIEGEKRLPLHLKTHQRPALGFNTDELAAKIPLSADYIVAYLFQNYLELFKVKSSSANASFDQTFEALESIAENFICADFVGRRAGSYDLGCGAESKLKEIAGLVAIRSLLFNMWFGETDVESSGRTSKGQWLPLYKPFSSKMHEMKSRREKIANELLINAISSETTDFDFNLIDMKREFFTTYLPYILLKASKMGPARSSPSASLTSFISRADYSFISTKPRPANTRFSAQTNENDYVDEDEAPDFCPPSSIPKSEPSKNEPKGAEVNQKMNLKKGHYIYEDLSCLNIIVENERF